jgi:hypothetical protein
MDVYTKNLYCSFDCATVIVAVYIIFHPCHPASHRWLFLVSRVIVVPANSTMSSSGMHEADSHQDPPNDQVIKRKPVL